MFLAFEKYITGYEKFRLTQLLAAKEARQDWLNASRTLATQLKLLDIVPEEWRKKFGCYSLWRVSDRASFVEKETYVAVTDVYTLDGKDYNVVLAFASKDARRWEHWRLEERVHEELHQHNKFLNDRHISKTDYDQADGRSLDWCKKRAKTDAENHRKSIEQKVHKIIGDVVEILEDSDGWYLNGSNGKRCHMWFISAGGYNIQCLHTRCLVKEVKLRKQ